MPVGYDSDWRNSKVFDVAIASVHFLRMGQLNQLSNIASRSVTGDATSSLTSRQLASIAINIAAGRSTKVAFDPNQTWTERSDVGKAGIRSESIL
jgi:hypothetical protein